MRMFNVVMTVLAAAAMAVFVTLLVSVVLWPDEAKLTAPLFCPDRVSSDVVREIGGSSVLEYSLQCTDAAGEVSDEGALRPLLVLFGVHTMLLIPLVVVSDRRGWSGRHVDGQVDDQFMHHQHVHGD